MLDFNLTLDPVTGENTWEIPLTGPRLLDCPIFNKGTAFSEDERREFCLLGLLPPHVSTLEQQLARIYEEYQAKNTDLERHIHLRSLQDRNEVLFYHFLQAHIAELMPIVYTPVVGEACQYFSHIYRRPRGLYISYPQVNQIDQILGNRPYRDVDVIVLTDGERILGLGDQGVGGMGIPIGKLALYSLCAGIHPARTLPIMLDVGTDNPVRLEDPLYVGWRHPRVTGKDYDDFVEVCIEALGRVLPKVLLQWEDFAQKNARRLLDRYRDRICSFNDDIQGTASVTLAALLAAARSTGSSLREQRLVILGAGSAGTGIADQISAYLVREGLSEQEAREGIFLVDRPGLLHSGLTGLSAAQAPYARAEEAVSRWERESDGSVSLSTVIRRAKPTVLVGVSGQPGAFTQKDVAQMAENVARPIIFPLSNPTSRCEATPADLMAWTKGRAIIATGSPFASVSHEGRSLTIGQCNNCYIFPGVGLGVVASGATRVTDGMFLEAAAALAGCSPAVTDRSGDLFPPLDRIRTVSRVIAAAVAREAQRAGVAPVTSPEELQQRISITEWKPHYPRLIRRYL
jgi:malate dehydrogenase (oxaloacetate-decarboxylating)